MNSKEINSLIKDPNFLGCFASNNLPQKVKRNVFSLIVNSDEKKFSGEHWLALHIVRDKIFYFDSFGCPILEEPIKKWIGNRVLFWSKRCIQSVKSQLCGYYCICFILTVNDNNSYKKFLDCFSDNLYDNDEILTYVIKRLI